MREAKVYGNRTWLKSPNQIGSTCRGTISQQDDCITATPRTQLVTEMSSRLKVLTWCVIAVVMTAIVGWVVWRPTEPVWKRHRLSEWLYAYDSHNRFDEGDDRGRRSPLSDQEIEEALDEMRPAALPVLLRWLTQKSGRWKPRLNQLLNQQSLVGFHFEERDYQILAVTGFMAYGEEAQPALPDLLKLPHSSDAHTRMLAYEAAFFTRPDKAIFLSLATRALREADPSIHEMAAQWLHERFPAEAEAILRKHE